MEATYHLNPGELNESFLKAMQLLFEQRRVKVTVEVEEDETKGKKFDAAKHQSRMSGDAQSLVSIAQMCGLVPNVYESKDGKWVNVTSNTISEIKNVIMSLVA